MAHLKLIGPAQHPPPLFSREGSASYRYDESKEHRDSVSAARYVPIESSLQPPSFNQEG